jgi:alpha-glucosidase (family GH31 glycosyl hydrolase)
VEFYLPSGRWTHLISGAVVEGGRWLREKHDFLSLPIYVRPGTVLPIGADATKPDYDYTRGLTLKLYGFDEGHCAVCRIPTLEGKIAAEIRVRRRHGQTDIEWDSDLKDIKVEIPETRQLHSAKSGSHSLKIVG